MFRPVRWVLTLPGVLLVSLLPSSAVAQSILTVAGSGMADGPATSTALDAPWGVALDASGNLFVADRTRIRRVDAGTGISTVVAGNGTWGSSGDGGPATAAQISPRGSLSTRMGTSSSPSGPWSAAAEASSSASAPFAVST